MPHEDPAHAVLDDLLRALPRVPIDPRVEERTLRRARAILVPERPSGLVHMLQTFWERALAPALVMGTVASYLAWAVQSAGSLYR